MLMNVQEIIDKAEALQRAFYSAKSKLDLHRENQRASQKALLKVEQEHTEFLAKFELQKLSLEAMKVLIERVAKYGVKKLEDLLSFGMRTIFHDAEHSIEIEIDESYNSQTAEFWLHEQIDGHSRRVRLRNATGGGVQSVVSLISRIYYMVHLDMRRFLVLDESLSQLSSAYVPGLFNFLHYVIRDLGFRILFITHDDRFLDYGDRLYEVQSGSIKKPKEISGG